VINRVEPDFPATARSAMGGDTDLIVILESVIAKSGCVRSVRPLTQAPFPELNAATLPGRCAVADSRLDCSTASPSM
jgi:hypothetical protein